MSVFLLQAYMRFKQIFLSKRLQIVFLIIGAVGGLLYWKFVGCKSGTCPIRSVWYWTTLWGGAMGYLVGDFISEIIRKRKTNMEEKK